VQLAKTEIQHITEALILYGRGHLPHARRKRNERLLRRLNAKWLEAIGAAQTECINYPVQAANAVPAAAELQSLAEQEVERLRGAGWTQADFARALRSFLKEKPSSQIAAPLRSLP